ncbi:NF-kappa-B inhibitor beta [Onychostruthus taczanowskii]|uniref:NF-kappa-B inhibitor beta n=1 Tax=Onychostruthus taczanowskii TaxID=356909 RepID=UPI001B80A2E2|nr:NF-kappa-B inhibitor beta [Onychostruthus taczanowskii]
MAAAAPAAPAAPGEAKRPEGDEWCDSGLGSLGEGPLGPPLPASPGAESPEPLADPAAWLRHVLSFVTEEGDTALHLAVIHEHEPFLESILRHAERSPYLDLQNDLGQVGSPRSWGSRGSWGGIWGAAAGRGEFWLGFEPPPPRCEPACAPQSPAHRAGAGFGAGFWGGSRFSAGFFGDGDTAQASRGFGILGGTWLFGEGSRLFGGHVGRGIIWGEVPRAQAGLWDPPCPPPTGYTPLHVAVLRRDLELVQLLLRAGADPDRPEPSCGRSPLHLAVEAQSPEVAECLLRGGARPDPRTFSGFTPLYSARRRPDPRLPPLLRRFGARDPPSSDSSDSSDSEGGAGDSEDEYDDIVINSRR